MSMVDLLEELTALLEDGHLSLIDGHNVLSHQVDRDQWRGIASLSRGNGRRPCVPIQLELLMHASLSVAWTTFCHEAGSSASVRHNQQFVIQGAHHGDVSLLQSMCCYDITVVIV